ncbi:MAG: type II toxin-antitoxin system VapC family toxin [bacterium]|nr:type II toxin-antitoxin system VapC family toxin [bacterium]
MTYLLDTNTCIRYLNGRSESIRQHVESSRAQDICVCAVVKAELFYGSMKSRHPERNLSKQKQFLDRFLSLPFDDKAAEVYGTIRASLEKTGTPIGPNDSMIAAIVLANTLTLVSNNTQEFKRVEGLKLVDWEI